jgi:hypothetical protein
VKISSAIELQSPIGKGRMSKLGRARSAARKGEKITSEWKMKPNDMEMYGRAGASGAAVLSSRCSGQGSFAAAAYFQN